MSFEQFDVVYCALILTLLLLAGAVGSVRMCVALEDRETPRTHGFPDPAHHSDRHSDCLSDDCADEDADRDADDHVRTEGGGPPARFTSTKGRAQQLARSARHSAARGQDPSLSEREQDEAEPPSYADAVERHGGPQP